jgi:hypothetical protein
MKNLIASAIVLVFGIVTAQAQTQTSSKEIKKELKTEKKTANKEARKMNATAVNARSKDSFLGDFPNATDVKWARSAQFDEATFSVNGIKTTAYYDYGSNLVGTTTNKKFADLPAAAQKQIKKDYKDYVVGSVILFDDNENNDTDMLLYGAQFEDADHYFVTIAKGGHEDVLMVTMKGGVSYFHKMS